MVTLELNFDDEVDGFNYLAKILNEKMFLLDDVFIHDEDEINVSLDFFYVEKKDD